MHDGKYLASGDALSDTGANLNDAPADAGSDLGQMVLIDRYPAGGSERILKNRLGNGFQNNLVLKDQRGIHRDLCSHGLGRDRKEEIETAANSGR